MGEAHHADILYGGVSYFTARGPRCINAVTRGSTSQLSTHPALLSPASFATREQFCVYVRGRALSGASLIIIRSVTYTDVTSAVHHTHAPRSLRVQLYTTVTRDAVGVAPFPYATLCTLGFVECQPQFLIFANKVRWKLSAGFHPDPCTQFLTLANCYNPATTGPTGTIPYRAACIIGG